MDCKMLDRNPFRSGLLYPREGAGLDEIPGSKIARLTLFPISGQFRTGLSCLLKSSRTGEEDHEGQAIYR